MVEHLWFTELNDLLGWVRAVGWGVVCIVLWCVIMQYVMCIILYDDLMWLGWLDYVVRMLHRIIRCSGGTPLAIGFQWWAKLRRSTAGALNAPAEHPDRIIKPTLHLWLICVLVVLSAVAYHGMTGAFNLPTSLLPPPRGLFLLSLSL